MKDKDQKLHIILIEGELGNVIRHNISKRKVKFLALAVVLFTAISIVYSGILTYKSLTYYVQTHRQISGLQKKLSMYKKERDYLKTKVASLKTEKKNTVEALAKRIEIIDSLIDKIGINVSSKGGEGGLAIPVDKLLTTNDVDLASSIPSLDNLIHDLKTTPLGFPTKGRISSGFGLRINPITKKVEFHLGIDIANKWGTPIWATADGRVIKAGWCGLMGNCVEIKHNRNYTTYYGHIEKVLVKKGDYVKRGQIIGKMGSTGRSTGPHVHYAIRYNGKLINPYPYMEVSKYDFEKKGREPKQLSGN